MKLGPVTKLDKRTKKQSKKFIDDVMSTNCDVIVIFLIYTQFGAIQKPDSERIVNKTYIFITNTALTLLLSVKILFLPKNADFDISKIKKALVLNGIFSETKYVCVLTNQISSS